MTRTSWIVPSALVLLAVVLRVAYVLALRSHPLFDAPNMDAGYHLAWAESLARGEEFQDGPFFRAPLYPLFLSFVLRVFGEGTLAPRLVQALLGGLTTWLTHRIATRVAGPVAGAVAAALVACSWILVAFDGELLIPTLFVPLTLLALERLLWWGFEDRPGRAALVGALFGLSALARPNVLLFMPLAFVVALVRTRGARTPLALTLGTCLALAPVTLHNVLEGDPALVATQGGVNLWIGNNPWSDGSSAIVPGTPDGWWEGYHGAIAQAEAAEGRTLRSSEVSRHFAGRAWAWMRGDPGAAAAHMAWKARLLVSNVELANNSDVEFTAMRTLPLLRATPARWDVLLGLGVVGLVSLAVRRRRGAGVLLAYLAVYAASVVLFFVSARFRVPLVPVLAIGSGAAVAELVAALRAARWARALAVVVPALALVWLSNRVPAEVQRGEAVGLMHLGIAELARGRADVAVEHLEAAYALAPTNLQVRYQLGSALLAQGGSLRRVLGLCEVPANLVDAPGAVDLGVLRLEARLRGEGAAAVLPDIERLLASRPADSELRFLRASTLAAAGRVPEALAALAEQAADEPENPEPHYGAGQILEQVGRPEEARAAYSRVLERRRFCAPAVVTEVEARLARLGGR